MSFVIQVRRSRSTYRSFKIAQGKHTRPTSYVTKLRSIVDTLVEREREKPEVAKEEAAQKLSDEDENADDPVEDK
ncbi:hypothetical protein NW762_003690 [Fusarium torreyae]|uniref:Uncharacterized protein n=1 Tax=Fusarium torreyae TaxID=1237075 RepID=A0A9W8S9S7_9HYPO|nr:hypothetical protein NW762_003690 [Fusarium torreyae]